MCVVQRALLYSPPAEIRLMVYRRLDIVKFKGLFKEIQNFQQDLSNRIVVVFFQYVCVLCSFSVLSLYFVIVFSCFRVILCCCLVFCSFSSTSDGGGRAVGRPDGRSVGRTTVDGRIFLNIWFRSDRILRGKK